MFDGDCGDDFKMGIALTPPTRGCGKGGGSEGAWGARLYAEFHYADHHRVAARAQGVGSELFA